jgi:hypothetical protein
MPWSRGRVKKPANAGDSFATAWEGGRWTPSQALKYRGDRGCVTWQILQSVASAPRSLLRKNQKKANAGTPSDRSHCFTEPTMRPNHSLGIGKTGRGKGLGLVTIGVGMVEAEPRAHWRRQTIDFNRPPRWETRPSQHLIRIQLLSCPTSDHE